MYSEPKLNGQHPGRQARGARVPCRYPNFVGLKRKLKKKVTFTDRDYPSRTKHHSPKERESPAQGGQEAAKPSLYFPCSSIRAILISLPGNQEPTLGVYNDAGEEEGDYSFVLSSQALWLQVRSLISVLTHPALK